MTSRTERGTESFATQEDDAPTQEEAVAGFASRLDEGASELCEQFGAVWTDPENAPATDWESPEASDRREASAAIIDAARDPVDGAVSETLATDLTALLTRQDASEPDERFESVREALLNGDTDQLAAALDPASEGDLSTSGARTGAADIHAVSQQDAERGGTHWNNSPPEYDQNLSFEDNAAEMRRYIRPRATEFTALHRDDYPSTDPEARITDAEVAAARGYGAILAQPYRDHENPARNLVIEQARQSLINTMARFPEGGEHPEWAGDALATLAHSAKVTEGFRPEANHTSFRDLHFGQELSDRQIAIGLLNGGEPAQELQEAFQRIRTHMAGNVAINQFLKQTGGDDALTDAETLYMTAMSRSVPELEIMPSGRLHRDSAAQIEKMMQGVDLLPSRRWMENGSEARDEVIDAAREMRSAAIRTRGAPEQFGRPGNDSVNRTAELFKSGESPEQRRHSRDDTRRRFEEAFDQQLGERASGAG